MEVLHLYEKKVMDSVITSYAKISEVVRAFEWKSIMTRARIENIFEVLTFAFGLKLLAFRTSYLCTNT